MRYLIYLFPAALALSIVGCASHDKDYIKQSKTVHPIVVPAGVAVKPQQNYYPVPASAPTNISAAPSLIPPGSNLGRFNPHLRPKKLKSPSKSNKRLATLSQTKNGEILELSENTKKAWVDVSEALRNTNYKILDQDPSMASFYVLDVTSTNNKITKDTPIYRLLLKAKGENTQVQLLNQKNQPAASNISNRILGALQKNLA